MELAQLIQIIVLLAIIGFGVWLLEQAPLSAVFKRAIQFVAILFLFLYILKTFAVL